MGYFPPRPSVEGYRPISGERLPTTERYPAHHSHPHAQHPHSQPHGHAHNHPSHHPHHASHHSPVLGQGQAQGYDRHAEYARQPSAPVNPNQQGAAQGHSSPAHPVYAGLPPMQTGQPPARRSFEAPGERAA
jgi:hypothetical protein